MLTQTGHVTGARTRRWSRASAGWLTTATFRIFRSTLLDMTAGTWAGTWEALLVSPALGAAARLGGGGGTKGRDVQGREREPFAEHRQYNSVAAAAAADAQRPDTGAGQDAQASWADRGRLAVDALAVTERLQSQPSWENNNNNNKAP